MEIKKANETCMRDIRNNFLVIKIESTKAEEALRELKHLYSECNWKKYDDDFKRIDLEEMVRKILLTEMECKKSVFSQKRALVLIQSLENEMNHITILLRVINQLPVTILKAQADVYELIESVRIILSEIELMMSTTEISSDKVKKMYKSIKEDFEKNKKDFDLFKSEEVDWIKFANLFSENHSSIIKTRNLVRVSRDSAKYKK